MQVVNTNQPLGLLRALISLRITDERGRQELPSECDPLSPCLRRAPPRVLPRRPEGAEGQGESKIAAPRLRKCSGTIFKAWSFTTLLTVSCLLITQVYALFRERPDLLPEMEEGLSKGTHACMEGWSLLLQPLIRMAAP